MPKKIKKRAARKTAKRPVKKSAKKTVKKVKKATGKTKFCNSCSYCSNGYTYRHCLGCGKCFCENHAGAWGYCYRCR